MDTALLIRAIIIGLVVIAVAALLTWLLTLIHPVLPLVLLVIGAILLAAFLIGAVAIIVFGK